MLTEGQLDTLIAINDHCDIHGELRLDHEASGLPDLLADLGRPDDEVYQAVADLHDLGLIDGTLVDQRSYPVLVTGLTARGHQELPAG